MNVTTENVKVTKNGDKWQGQQRKWFTVELKTHKDGDLWRMTCYWSNFTLFAFEALNLRSHHNMTHAYFKTHLG